MKKLLHKIQLAKKIVKTYKNWKWGFLDYFKLIKKNKKILYKLRNGNFYLTRARRGDFEIINEIYIIKEYNKLLNHIKENSTIIDIGAHIGIFSVFAAKKRFFYLQFWPPCLQLFV